MVNKRFDGFTQSTPAFTIQKAREKMMEQFEEEIDNLRGKGLGTNHFGPGNYAEINLNGNKITWDIEEVDVA